MDVEIEMDQSRFFSNFEDFLVNHLHWCPGKFGLFTRLSNKQGVQKLKGDNLKVVWSEFSTLSWAVLL
jgi:hypothetical protein